MCLFKAMHLKQEIRENISDSNYWMQFENALDDVEEEETLIMDAIDVVQHKLGELKKEFEDREEIEKFVVTLKELQGQAELHQTTIDTCSKQYRKLGDSHQRPIAAMINKYKGRKARKVV
eukprot:m.91883 g.91883  ORF g.91883 m.91883 type:complete len:120 (-) comp12340_c0_seq1:2599-2958(-)